MGFRAWRYLFKKPENQATTTDIGTNYERDRYEAVARHRNIMLEYLREEDYPEKLNKAEYALRFIQNAKIADTMPNKYKHLDYWQRQVDELTGAAVEEGKK